MQSSIIYVCSMSTSGVGDDNGSGNEQNYRGKRRTREESRSVVVEKMLRKEKTDRLVVKFDPLTGKSVGKIGTSFNNMIHQIVRDTFSPRITRWADVPKTDIEVVYDRLDLKFIYPHDNKIVMDEIEKLQMKALREWRYAMKCHWKKLGGEENKEAPKRTPYKKVDPEQWKALCDFFSCEEQKLGYHSGSGSVGTGYRKEIGLGLHSWAGLTISAKNSHNRKQRPLEGGQGSKTIVAHVYDGVDLVTGELPSVIDTFQQLHCKGNRWRNEYAAEKHDAMTHMRASQPVESAGSVESGDEVAQPKDLEIMTQVLGPRSRHHKGYGSMPRLKAVGGSRATSSRSTYEDREKDKIIATLKEQVASQEEKVAGQAVQLAAQAEQLAAQNRRLNETNEILAQLQKFIPGFQFQPPTGPSSDTSNSLSNN
ncbi:hypothetical protein LguiA_007964 [Lonicera macranthoides]